MTKRHPDADLLARLGGPAKVAELLSYDKQAGGIQRVQNWMTRGIPAQVKVDRPDLFLVASTALPAAATPSDAPGPRRERRVDHETAARYVNTLADRRAPATGEGA